MELTADQEKEVARLRREGVKVDPPEKLVLDPCDAFLPGCLKWATAIHKLNRAKGWWSKGVRGRNFPEVILLMKSEIVEAHEEYRKPDSDLRKVWFGSDGKPEGVSIELADCAIRILDLVSAVAFEWKIELPDFEDEIYPISSNIGEAFDDVTALLTYARDAWECEEDEVAKHRRLMSKLLGVLRQLFLLSEKNEIDLGEAIVTKWRYNCTRPFRHGGKRA